jgi:hypothetical protein
MHKVPQIAVFIKRTAIKRAPVSDGHQLQNNKLYEVEQNNRIRYTTVCVMCSRRSKNSQ